jgi:predicted phage baseplate assembly protein
MPLPLPRLDKLNYDELVAEARGNLPALAPDWTDYNAHDPGITLLELLAWLTEIDSYRLDQIPPASYRAFLRLAGITLRPSQIAQTVLVFAPLSGSRNLPPGVGFPAADAAVTFSTTAKLFVSKASLQSIASSIRNSTQPGAQLVWQEFLQNGNKPAAAFYPFGTEPRPGDALYLGFDQALTGEEDRISLWVNVADESASKSLFQQLLQAYKTHRAYKQAGVQTQAEAACATPRIDIRRHYSAQTIWEYHAGNGIWLPLKEVTDKTRALSMSGFVRFKIPQGTHQPGGISGHEQNYAIRCRLSQGAYDCPPQLVAVHLNAVMARNQASTRAQHIRSNGQAGQRLTLPGAPVVPGSTKVTVTPKGGINESWREVSSWDGIGPFDRVYVLEPETGALVFGDGRIGRVLPAAPDKHENVTVDYRIGGGESGNVPVHSLDSKVTSALPALPVVQPYAATGGAAAETLTAAKARAVRKLAEITRAVTLKDYEQLALATPGVPVARAHAIVDYHPAMPCVPVSGCVTVVVLPSCPDNRPSPTPALLTAVQQHLDRHRLLTSEIHVIAPHYVTVAVSATLHTRPSVDGRALIVQAQQALQTFFHPLHGGPDRNGWPFGRAVFRSELLALLNNLNGVMHVAQLGWTIDGSPIGLCGNITLCPHGLVASGQHQITINQGSSCHE